MPHLRAHLSLNILCKLSLSYLKYPIYIDMDRKMNICYLVSQRVCEGSWAWREGQFAS